MTVGALSRRYAKALFQLAREMNQEEEIGREVERFLAIYESSELAKTFESPVFSLEEKKNIFRRVAQASKFSLLTDHFLLLLLERDRLSYVAAIVQRYRRLLDELKGRVRARVVASAPVNQTTLAQLREALEKISGKEVLLDAETDSELLGGLLVELEGKIYDGSVRNQLDRLTDRVARGY